MIDVTDADTYFETHLENDSWTSIDSDKRQACLNMAEADICAKLAVDEIDSESETMLNAVYEQAVYLGVNYDKIKNFAFVTSESLDGVGSRSYSSTSGMSFSKRALMLLRRITGPNFLSRG